VGLFTLTELAHRGLSHAAVSIPIIVDADTGFGRAGQCERTVAELEAGRRRGDSA